MAPQRRALTAGLVLTITFVAGRDLRLGIAVAFAAAAAVGLAGLAVTRRLPAGPTTAAPPPVTEPSAVRHPGSS